jgi:hypothetical protein
MDKPFFEAESWKPMTADEITRALDELRNLPGAEMLYLPEFYCKRNGLNFEETNRTLSLKEAIESQKRKPVTARERLQAKLEERKKYAANTK